MSKEKVIIKKVSAYPINVQLINEVAPPQKGEIIKLTSRGFFADLGELILRIRDEFDCCFMIPASDIEIRGRVTVMKNFDRNVGGRIQRLSEFHFLGLPEDRKNLIKKFLIAIKQEEI